MTRQQFIEWATSRGWKADKYGHLQKTRINNDLTSTQMRYKLSSIAVRYEVKVPGSGWLRVRSGYFSKLSLNESNQLVGMNR